jgi:hypothetical protein
MRIVVVLPAPLGPRKPTTSPFVEVEVEVLDGRVAPKRRVRCSTVITGERQ